MGAAANRYNRAFRLDDRNAIDVTFATKMVGSRKGLSKQGLVLIGDDGEEEELTDDTEPMRRAVAFSKSIKGSQQMTEVFGRLAELCAESYYERDAAPHL